MPLQLVFEAFLTDCYVICSTVNAENQQHRHSGCGEQDRHSDVHEATWKVYSSWWSGTYASFLPRCWYQRQSWLCSDNPDSLQQGVTKTLNLLCTVIIAQRELLRGTFRVYADKNLSLGILILITGTNLEKWHLFFFFFFSENASGSPSAPDSWGPVSTTLFTGKHDHS